MASGSVLGAIRDRLFSDPALAAAVPGGCHANELPSAVAGGQTLPYPALVLRYPRTQFQYVTADVVLPAGTPSFPQLERPHVELWLECLDAEDGEALARQVQARLTDSPLAFSPGVVVQLYPTDLFLHPETGRNARGEKQYSWCLAYDVWIVRNR